MNAHAEIIKAFEAAFRSESGPARCGNPRHCEECEEADRMLIDLDPRDLNLGDLSNESRNWIFSFATDESIRWLSPGIVRVVLEQSPVQPNLFFDLIRNRATDVFTEDQWITILGLADFCHTAGWIERKELGYFGPGTARSSEI